MLDKLKILFTENTYLITLDAFTSNPPYETSEFLVKKNNICGINNYFKETSKTSRFAQNSL